MSISNCNVAVIGGAGFLGSHLVNHLINDRKCKVLAIDNLVVGKIEFLHPSCEFCWHDITGSEERLRQIFEKFETEYVFNYAAYPYIPVSFERPLHVFNVNANGAIKVINAAQDAGVRGILQVSSAEIYGGSNGSFGKVSEEFPVAPHSTYGAAKAAVDYYCQCAWRERQTPVIALRQFNCIGERETHPYVVPEIISQLSKYHKNWPDGLRIGNELKFKSNPVSVKLGNNSFRDFLYAGDAVAMAVELLEKGKFGEVYNLGSENGIKIYDLAKKIGLLMGFKDIEIFQDPSRIRPWEIWHLQSDNSKIYSTIGRRPEVDLEMALEITYMDNFNKSNNKWAWEK